MKKYFCILAACMIMQVATGQTVSAVYLFDEFVEGKVYYQNGQIAKTSLNIELLQNTVVMLSEKKEILSLTDPSNIRMIALDQRFFVYRNNRLMEVLELGTISLLLHRRTELWDKRERPAGAYGVETAAGSIQQYTSFEGHPGAVLGINDASILKSTNVVENNTIYVEKDGKLSILKNLKTLTKWLSKEQAASLERYCESLGLGYETEADAKNLIRYANSLITGE